MLFSSFLPSVHAETLASKLSGRVLLQVEKNGETWYVNPKDQKRYCLACAGVPQQSPLSFGVGISNKDLAKIPVAMVNSKEVPDTLGMAHPKYDMKFAKAQKGKIFLQVQSHGEGWYVNPVDMKRYSLGFTASAFSVMNSLGLGISEKYINTIPVGYLVTPKKEVTPVSSLTELKIQDLLSGTTGATALSGDEVTVQYTGELNDGTKFDSSYDRNQPFTFTLGKGMVIEGFDKGITGMKVGGNRELAIPASMAYGNNSQGSIPAGSDLYFSVHLVSIKGK